MASVQMSNTKELKGHDRCRAPLGLQGFRIDLRTDSTGTQQAELETSLSALPDHQKSIRRLHGRIVEFAFGRLNSLRELKAATAALKFWHPPFKHRAQQPMAA